MFLNWYPWIKIPLSLSGLVWGIFISPVTAQISPDATLGGEHSVVTPNLTINGVLSDRVDGGAIRGGNLFQSFSDFNVPEGRGVYFSNPAGITNIINRVTGNQASSILGKLGVLGSANLFLVNPNGIIFGPHASLDLGGSFVATTANAIQFGDQGVFSATNPEVPPLLTVNPSAFIFNRLRPNAITLNSATEPSGTRSHPFYEDVDVFGLRVPDGKSLILLGGDVSLINSQLNALGGQVEIGSVSGTGNVGFNLDNNVLSLNFPNNLELGNVSLAQDSRIYTIGDRGGSIQITGNNIRLTEGSVLNADTLGSQSGRNITLKATDTIEITTLPLSSAFSTNLSTANYGEGNGGNIVMMARQVMVKDGAQVLTLSLAEGTGGNITIDASEKVEILGKSSQSDFFPSSLNSVSVSEGIAGNIEIKTQNLSLLGGGFISTASLGEGNSFGDQSFVGQGAGGNITINASNSVLIDSFPFVNPNFVGRIESATYGIGNAGKVTINTRSLTIQNGGAISVSSEGEGEGNAGNLSVNASQSINLIGNNSILLASGAGARPAGNLTIKTGALNLAGGAQINLTSPMSQAGNLTIEANTIQLRDFNSKITASTATGQAGNVNIRAANSIELSGESGLFVEATNGGMAGNLTIETGDLRVNNGAQVTVSSPLGQAGNLRIDGDRVFLDNGFLTAETAKTGINGANITLNLNNFLLMQNESLISAKATGDANGGNVTINTPLVAAFSPSGSNGSNIIAQAERGTGGNIIINAQGIFGIAEGRAIAGNRSNNIDASSEFGAPGRVQLNTTINPTQGLVTLPEQVVDPNTLIAENACRRGTSSQLTLAGRGGLPPNVYEDLNSTAVQVGLVEPAPSSVTKPISAQSTPQNIAAQTSENAIAPAQGWVFNQQGEVMLVAYHPTATGNQRIQPTESGCPIP